MRLSQCPSAFAQSLRTRSAAPVSTFPRLLSVETLTEAPRAQSLMKHHFTHVGLGSAGRSHDCLREICGNQPCSVVLRGAIATGSRQQLIEFTVIPSQLPSS